MYRNIELENKIRQMLKYEKGEKKVFNHKKIDMGACCKNETNESWNNNKEVCLLFKNHFAFVSLVVCTWKGSTWGYIVPKDKFDDWWLEDNQYKGLGGDGVDGLKHLYCEDYSGDGTCAILTDLYRNCRWFENEILKAERKHKKYIEGERKKER